MGGALPTNLRSVAFDLFFSPVGATFCYPKSCCRLPIIGANGRFFAEIPVLGRGVLKARFG